MLIYGPCWIPANNMVAFAVHKVDDILYAPGESVYDAWAEDVIQWGTDADHGHEEAADGSEYQQSFFTPKQGGYVGVFQGSGEPRIELISANSSRAVLLLFLLFTEISRKVALEGISLNVLSFPCISSDWRVGGESLPRPPLSAKGFASYRLPSAGPFGTEEGVSEHRGGNSEGGDRRRLRKIVA